MFNPRPKKGMPQKKPRQFLKRSPIKWKKKATGERPVFDEIERERGAVSEISGDPIYNISARNFLHVLAKGQNKFPKFKLYKKNIIIGTWEEHDKYDNGSHDELRKDPAWKWVFELRDELMKEYKQLHG